MFLLSIIKNDEQNNLFNVNIIYISYFFLLIFSLIAYATKEHVINYEYKGTIPDKYKKIVIYSCLIGDYDNVSSFNRQEGYDYILFTDQNIKNTNWTVLPIPKFVDKMKISKIKKHRYIKIHPHKFFKNYDLSLYIDANYIITGDMNEFLENTLNKIDHIYITHLQFGRHLKKTISEAIKNDLDNPLLLKDAMNRYYKLGILKKRGIVNAGLIIRKHHEPDVIKLMDAWWEEVRDHSHVDNIAFNYAGYKTGVRFLYMSYQFTLYYFDHSKHKKKYTYVNHTLLI